MNKSLNIFEKRLISPGLNAKDVCLHVFNTCLTSILAAIFTCKTTWLPVFRGISCACLSWAVPVFVGLCLSLLRCACPCWAVPVFVTVCLSVLGCACLCYVVPVRVELCLSSLRCACPCWAVPVFVMSCLIEFSCDGPCVCLGCLETEY